MNISEPFIHRPVATSLLSLAVLLAGGVSYNFLPVAPLPQVDFPTISVSGNLPGASPETMASAVATPLERQFGRIAGVTEMTSSSQLGSSNVTLQLDLNRDINAAARDVQAAINASAGQLPSNLPSLPNYRKTNPADAPIMILGMTSDTIPRSQIYDVCDSILAQKLAQISGVGQSFCGGGAKPSVRVDLNPMAMSRYGIGLEDVRAALAAANAHTPKGSVEDSHTRWLISDTDQLLKAPQYVSLIVAYRHGSPVRLSDLGTVTEGVEDVRNAGMANGKLGVLVIVFRQPGANTIGTVDRIQAVLPLLRTTIPAAINLDIINDPTTTIRASVHDIELALLTIVALVILVIFIFLRNVWATVIPSVSVPLSLVGTFGAMYLLGYSIDNLSLMALAISTGFVVDDAIVVIENIARHLELGESPMQAALSGSREIGFTVLSMSTSLVAVFIPILLMGGIVGRLFREFAVTLSVAIGVSLCVSLTTTPMMCAKFLKPPGEQRHGRLYYAIDRSIQKSRETYLHGLRWVLGHQPAMLAVTVCTLCLSVYLYVIVPKGFFPQQDTGRLTGNIVGAQDISFPAMRAKLLEFGGIVLADPDVQSMGSWSGGGAENTGHMFIQLKPIGVRKLTADQVIARLRKKLAAVPGATLYLQAVQDIRVGGRGSNAQYQYTLEGEDLNELLDFAPRVLQRLKSLTQLRDVSSDQQDRGLQAALVIDRDTAARLGVATRQIDNTLYDAFGQRQVSTIFTQLNQYHVVMEVAPELQQSTDALKNLFVQASNGAQVPLSAFTHFERKTTALAVNHQGQFPAVTISFNLAPNVALGDAVDAIDRATRDIGMPSSIRANFQGVAQAFQASLATEPYLILAALLTVYIVLGILYESYIHPITILSTLPSAGVGALMALLIMHTELSVIALIGILLLIGIVKKNAIMIVDFAQEARRRDGKSAVEAIYQACSLRFRPIMMTTMAALFGGMPLAIGGGAGSELRRPLGISIVGGLLVSQILTLFTAPVIYLYMDRFQAGFARRRAARRAQQGLPPQVPASPNPSI